MLVLRSLLCSWRLSLVCLTSLICANNGDKFYRRKSMRVVDEKLIIKPYSMPRAFVYICRSQAWCWDRMSHSVVAFIVWLQITSSSHINFMYQLIPGTIVVKHDWYHWNWVQVCTLWVQICNVQRKPLTGLMWRWSHFPCRHIYDIGRCEVCLLGSELHNKVGILNYILHFPHGFLRM